jgi:hypothetical protein
MIAILWIESTIIRENDYTKKNNVVMSVLLHGGMLNNLAVNAGKGCMPLETIVYNINLCKPLKDMSGGPNSRYNAPRLHGS